MRHVASIPGMEGRIKENDGGVNSTRYIVRTFVKFTMYPQYSNII
jgi:hypothetical protein